jgi:hypothetical protein
MDLDEVCGLKALKLKNHRLVKTFAERDPKSETMKEITVNRGEQVRLGW